MAGMRDANVTQWIEALSWIDDLPDDLIVVPGHGEICGKKDVRNLRERFLAMWKIMETLIKKGRSKSDAVADSAFLKYFYADESLGAQWVQQRKKTFQEGLERLYDEVKGG
jgi:glyoxylase-like metal-dependent hydrolase (beta-lactamase superfamily II)